MDYYGTLKNDDAIVRENKTRCYILIFIGVMLAAILGVMLYIILGTDVFNKNENDPIVPLPPDSYPSEDEFIVPQGFNVSYYLKPNVIHSARQMVVHEFDDDTTIIYLVGSPFPTNKGLNDKVWALVDTDFNTQERGIYEIFQTPEREDMRNSPTSVALDTINNWLYITEWSITWVCKDNNGMNIHEQVMTGGVLTNCIVAWDNSENYYQHHGWHYTAMNPNDNKLCMSFGVACNYECGRNIPESTISCFNDMDNMDVNDMTIHAAGVRDAVGMAFHPITKEMWFTDNNKDRMGDDIPDCELNRVSYIGEDFGHPWCHSEGVGSPYLRDVGGSFLLIDDDPAVANETNFTCDPNRFTVNIQALGPHTAPLGMMFYTGSMFPERYNNAVFIAEHGSWDRTLKIGFRVAVVLLGTGDDNSTVVGHEIFMDGFLNVTTQTEIGRPCDVAMLKDGSLLVSDDENNCIYRITYQE
eukprot:CAMPEP_0114659880 /NCGR_PEP_ID=MMETSP0191-20121206/18759_1 /TAXON_ID=126664 /ORGANISM="Sorites sp." /LENGTH=469 /DNA_ID=CAMNT_0001886483 /DNA_START=85 /DNA_END=1494 /DNA_ORIENTATION=-